MLGKISIGSAISADIVGTTTPAQAIEDIRAGKWGSEIADVRAATGKEQDRLKKNLPAFLWSGTFVRRANASLLQHSGLICADIDKVNEGISRLQDIARKDSHAVAAFVSPTGTGFKIVFRARDFNAVRCHVSAHYNVAVDEAAKDVARLCFVSHDPEAFYNPDAVELAEASAPEPKAQPTTPASAMVHPASRLRIAERILGEIKWIDETTGLCKCPGEHLHTSGNAAKDCQVMLDRVPTINCFHASCGGIVAGVNHELRSQIGRAECVPGLPLAANSGRVAIAAEYLGTEPKAELAADSLPEPIDAVEFLATPIPMPEVLVRGLFDKGGKYTLGGASKAKKTWLLADLAVSVQAGSPWLGIPTKKGKVLYINFEIRKAHWQHRLQKIVQAKGIKLEPGQLVLWNLRGQATDFKVIIPMIIKSAASAGFDLIILDPIYKIYGAGADENSAGDMAALMNGLERIAVQTGAAIFYGSHFSKGNQAGKDPIDRISGSGVYGRDPDGLLIFTEHNEPDAFTVSAILRDFAPMPDFVVRWQFPLMMPADDLDPARLKEKAGGRPKAHDSKKILSAIAETTSKKPTSLKAWAEAANISRSTLDGYLPEMRRKNWIETVGFGNSARQTITNEGRAFLNE